MSHIFKQARYFALTLSFAAGMSGIAIAQSSSVTTQHHTSPAQQTASANQDNANGANSSSMTMQAQRELAQKGYYSGKVDGVNGPETRTAIRQFQQAENLRQTGTLNDATCNRLGIRNNMQGANAGEASRSTEDQQSATNGNATSGSTEQNANSAGAVSKETVREAQQKLTKDGFYSGRIDGMMNQGTRSALERYQKQNNLTVNGRLTRETARSMGIATSSNQNYENGSPMEQLGKGLAEGAKSNRQRQDNH